MRTLLREVFMYKISLLFLIAFVSGCGFECNVKSRKVQPKEDAPVIIVELAAPIKSSCPSDMQEVDGNYCEQVEQVCINLDKNIHNANGYVKCDEFDKTKCLSKTTQKMHFCIDTYEYPNKKNVLPDIMISWSDVKNKCEAQGKRLCADKEWTLACEGPEILPYPYGYKRDASACNIDHMQRPGFDASKPLTPEIVSFLDQRVASGVMPNCVSYYGVHDLTGNVDEATVNSSGRPFKNALKGGAWLYGHRARCRPATTVHDENFIFYESSGRCCKDAE